MIEIAKRSGEKETSSTIKQMINTICSWCSKENLSINLNKLFTMEKKVSNLVPFGILDVKLALGDGL